jgi:hypothetical protein
VSLAANTPARHRVPSALVLGAVCTGIVVVTLLAAGVRVSEVFLFIGFQLLYAIVPGLLLSYVLLGPPRSFLDGLAVAAALGLAAQIGCFVLAAAVGQRWLFTVFPVVFAIPALALLRRAGAGLRASWRARPRTAVAARVAVVAVLVTAAASIVVFLSLFAPSPLPREIDSVSYYPDLVANISLAAELLHHWPFMSPSVTGVALHYNIFTNVDMAAAAQVTRLQLAAIVMRLQPAFLVGVIAIQLFALGRRVGGSHAAGLTALVLGLFAGELNLSKLDLAGGGVPVLGGLYSASYQIGAVFFLAILIVLVERLWPAAGSSRARHWSALAVLSLGATGAKASVLPVLAGGLALFVVGQGIARRSARVATIGLDSVRALAIVLGAGAAGYVLIYRGGGHGQALGPLAFLSYTGFASIYRHARDSSVYVPVACVAALVTLCWLLASLVGALFVKDRWWPRASCASPERLLMCLLAASLVPFVSFEIPGDTEVYYLVYGFLAASVVAAAGATAMIERLRLRTALSFRRDALALGAIAVIALSVISESFAQTAPTIERWLRGAHAFTASGIDERRGITAELLQGLLWLREHTPPSAVIAVNNHESDDEGDSNYFYYSAFSERRVFLESWEETPQGYEYLLLGRPGSPFPGLLALNDAAVLGGSPAAISLLGARYGVRYLVIDRLHGGAAPDLSRVARLVYANAAIAIFRSR